MRKFKFRYYWKHDGTGEIRTKEYDLDDIQHGHIQGPDFTIRWDLISTSQFCGLHDKNGKEIFEGDLLRWAGDDDKNFTAFEVFFHDGNSNAAYDIGYSISRTHHQGNVVGGYIPPLKPKTTRKMIVIGNIFQDKHLLK